LRCRRRGGRVGEAAARAASARRQQARSVASSEADAHLQLDLERLVLAQPVAAAALAQPFGIARLVVVDRARERAPGCCRRRRAQFGDGQRAGAADHQSAQP
jgi:hypothetical protein